MRVGGGAEKGACLGRQQGTRNVGTRREKMDRGDGRVTMRIENSQTLQGNRNYAEIMLHLKHVRVYGAPPLAAFLTPIAVLTSLCAHTHRETFITTLLPEVTSAV